MVFIVPGTLTFTSPSDCTPSDRFSVNIRNDKDLGDFL